MSPLQARSRQRRSSVLSAALGSLLLVLVEGGLLFLPAPFGWSAFYQTLIGVPICYPLICGLAAFFANFDLLPEYVWGKGARFGCLVGLVGFLALLIGSFFLWSFTVSDYWAHTPHRRGAGIGPVVLYVTLLFFLGLNLTGVLLAPLGGMLGGFLRAHVGQRARRDSEVAK